MKRCPQCGEPFEFETSEVNKEVIPPQPPVTQEVQSASAQTVVETQEQAKETEEGKKLRAETVDLIHSLDFLSKENQDELISHLGTLKDSDVPAFVERIKKTRDEFKAEEEAEKKKREEALQKEAEKKKKEEEDRVRAQQEAEAQKVAQKAADEARMKELEDRLKNL